MRRNLLLSLVASATLLAGCDLSPDYHRPVLPTAPTYPANGASARPTMPPAQSIAWEAFFTDARLRRLIGIALRDNRDLRTAIIQVAQAQAQFRLARADLFPSIGLQGSANYQGLSDSGLVGSSASSSAGSAGVGNGGSAGTGAGSGSSGFAGQGGGTFRYYQAGVGFSSYEIDLFGRLRNLSRQAFETWLAQRENQRAVQITVIGTVASDYIAWLADREQLKVTQDTLGAQSATLRLTQAEFDHGATTLLTLRQVQTSVETARANLAQYQRQVAQDVNALVLDIGAPLPADLPPPAPLGSQTLLADIPAGLPSDLLTQRPDIMQAEHTLLAANANIGAARAAFFPQLTLTASDGLQSLQFNKLFTSAATTWTVAPALTVPIFNWGKNRANLDIAKTQADADVAAYEKTIQTAFREVSDALVARATYRDQTAAQQRDVNAASDYYRLAKMRFDAGVDTYLTTLDAQRSLYAAQQTLVSVREAQLQNLVTVYRALGGGWTRPVAGAKPVASPG